MPIAKFKMPDGRIARFNVPEGTTPEQAQIKIKAMVGAGLNQPAKPEQAVEPTPGMLDNLRQAILSAPGGSELAEFGAAINRGTAQLADFFTTKPARAVQQLAGVPQEERLPTVEQTFEGATKGEFMEPGLARDIVRKTGEVIPAAAGGGALLRAAAGAVPTVQATTQTLGQGLTKQLGATTAAQDVGYGALSGAGFEAGGEAGEATDIALGGTGETGRAIGEFAGSIALPIAGAVTKQKISPQKPSPLAETARKQAIKNKIKEAKEALDINKKTADAVNITKPKTDAGKIIGKTKTEAAPEVKDYKEILDNLKAKKANIAAIDAMPDAEIMKAADDLGIDLNPDHYSNNRIFQEVTQSLKSRPGSKLGSIEQKAIEGLGKRADSLISKMGGQTDKSLLDANIGNDINGTIARLEAQSNAAYAAVDSVIPKAVKVKPLASRAYINSTLKDLGNDANQLSNAEKHLLSIIKKNPTYSALDRIRKDVGNGFRKNAGPFKDDDTGTLKQVYRVLSEDQQGVSDSFGVGADYAAARRLVASRKQIEDQAVQLFGRDVGGSIVPKLTQAATALTKGDVTKFHKLMQAIPENRRQEAAATMLNDIFTQGARQKDGLGQGFVAAFKGLNRNKGAKDILFAQLPAEARARFNKIGIVANGLYRSKSLENTSKTARDLISAMDDGGMFTKVYDVGKKVAVAEGISTAIGLPGAGSAGVIGSVLAKGRTPASVAADNFIVSKAFKKAIESSVKTGRADIADKILKNSPEFKAWRKFLTGEQKSAISKSGFVSWITDQKEAEQ